WAEATLLDLIEHLNGSVEGVPLLILCGARPTLLEQRDGWSASPIAELIELQPLSDEESERVIANLLGETGLADEAQGRIVAAAEGNPLFVEQMLSMMIEEGHVQRVDGKWLATGDLGELEFEEILGYHLEQAYQYLAELGPLDDHGRDVGGRASDRLGSAGRRALARGDMPAAANLLRRAVELLPPEDPRRVKMLPDLYE